MRELRAGDEGSSRGEEASRGERDPDLSQDLSWERLSPIRVDESERDRVVDGEQ